MPFRTRYTGLVNKYHDRLPLADDVRVVSLGEGATPLIRLNNIPRTLGSNVDLYVKYEGLNPTGSFKDRGMTVAVTHAVSEGSEALICASTGNTSASAAAYAARAGIKAFVLIPDGKIALGKLAQAIMHGATVLQIRGNFDDGMRIVKELAEQAPVSIVNSVNPYRLQGQKTAAFEIVEELERVPDYHCLPVGNAGNITAHWMGYSELALGPHDPPTAAYLPCGHRPFHSGVVRERPRMVGYQASGSAPFLRGGAVSEPETVATAIRIGNPQSWDYAWAASSESGGWFDELTDEEILATQRMLADHEGIFCEPASAASVAGTLRDVRSGRIEAGSTVVCTLTGHGLKDPDVAKQHADGAVSTVDATTGAVKDAILGRLS
ncbi:Threonine synthase [wastewater metagenome]|uniref:Threonine synthase n=2 Tax=unclassified sequences TaxID=12908 RepID=A0A5B8R7S5_9ZZZZ|nr:MULTISPECIES: threonine synthase [Arhodomonas]MCS4503230.1 threonine synthase [Arhodomonas aquaeolei]QEA04766.1 threonine synthase [uncultured organism]